MFWLVIIITSYLFFSLASLGDRYLLIGPPNPKIYTFYVGVLGNLVLILAPFIGFGFIPFYQTLLCLLTGFVFTFATFSLFKGLEDFEASKIIPAFGGFLPLFIFALTFLFSKGEVILQGFDFLAFLILVLGSILITIEPGKNPSKFFFKKFWEAKSLKTALVIAFVLSLYFVLAKYVYILQPFWTGFIWIRIGAFLTALFFLFSKEVKTEIFKQKFTFTKKTASIFILAQGIGAAAVVLQNWAIALAYMAYLAVISALQGIQYFFLFVLSVLISWKFPHLLEERISKKIIIRKTIAIIIIALGLVILAL